MQTYFANIHVVECLFVCKCHKYMHFYAHIMHICAHYSDRVTHIFWVLVCLSFWKVQFGQIPL